MLMTGSAKASLIHVIIATKCEYIDQSSSVILLTLLFVIGSAKTGIIHVIIAIDCHFSIPRLILTANIANIHMLSE